MIRAALTPIAAAALMLALAAPSFASPTAGGDIGVGISLGEPTGLSAKAWLDQQHALDFAASWSFEDDRIALYGDYLFHFWDALGPKAKHSAFRLPLYIGIGGKISLGSGGKGHFDKDDNVGLGVRVPLGVTMVFTEAPFDIFLEITPGILLVPKSSFDFDAALGARFYF
jgi:hypothetical protein